MRVGLALPQFDFSVPGESPLRWTTLLDHATRAERLGFGSLWLADHLFFEIDKYGAAPGPFGGFDVLVGLAGVARATTSARLGSLVLCAPLRPPGVLAKALTTLDLVCCGRLVVGLGAGWYEPEFRAAGVEFSPAGVRLEQLAEAVQIVRGIFEGGPFSFMGRHFSVTDAPGLPRPAQVPSPPVWVGGKGDRLLELCARHADGWNTVWTWTPSAWRERSAFLDAACQRAGRSPNDVERSVGLYALVGEDRADLARRWERLQRSTPPGVLSGLSLDEWRDGHLVGTPDEVRDQLEEWAAAGVSELIVGAGAVPFAVASPDDLDMVASACSLGETCSD